MRVPNGCAQAELKGNVEYLRIHWSADNRKTQEWADKLRDSMDRVTYLQQMEMKRDVYEGIPVFPEYDDDRSCPYDVCRRQPIPLFSRADYYCGVDAGQTVNPAAVLLQVTERPFQIHALAELTNLSGGEPMSQFALRMASLAQEILPGRWNEVRYVGDPTIATRNGSTGETARSVALRTADIDIKPGRQSWPARYSAVSWLIRDMIEEDMPRFLIDGTRCPVLRAGFKGAYKWETGIGDEKGPAAKYKKPNKNSFSHVQDALQYVMVEIQKIIENRGAKVFSLRGR